MVGFSHSPHLSAVTARDAVAHFMRPEQPHVLAGAAHALYKTHSTQFAHIYAKNYLGIKRNAPNHE